MLKSPYRQSNLLTDTYMLFNCFVVIHWICPRGKTEGSIFLSRHLYMTLISDPDMHSLQATADWNMRSLQRYAAIRYKSPTVCVVHSGPWTFYIPLPCHTSLSSREILKKIIECFWNGKTSPLINLKFSPVKCWEVNSGRSDVSASSGEEQ